MLRRAFHATDATGSGDRISGVVYRLLPARNGLAAVNFIYSPPFPSRNPFLPFIRLLFTPFAPFRFLRETYICIYI